MNLSEKQTQMDTIKDVSAKWCDVSQREKREFQSHLRYAQEI